MGTEKSWIACFILLDATYGMETMMLIQKCAVGITKYKLG